MALNSIVSLFLFDYTPPGVLPAPTMIRLVLTQSEPAETAAGSESSSSPPRPHAEFLVSQGLLRSEWGLPPHPPPAPSCFLLKIRSLQL